MAPGQAGDLDPVRVYTPAEERRLAANLWGINRHVLAGRFADRPVSLSLLSELHAEFFEGVRDHAGKTRSRDFGSEVLMFGPNWSVRREDVQAELSTVFQKSETFVARLLRFPDDPQYEAHGIQIAVWTHAEIIRIHPFEDGNGRTCRTLLDAILVRLGLRPVPVDVPKEEYREALNHYYQSGDIEPLVDLYIWLYADRLSPRNPDG